MIIQAATELAPDILKAIAGLDEKNDDQLARRMLEIVGPALMKVAEFESVLLDVAFAGQPELADAMTYDDVFSKREEAAKVVFAGLSREVGFWSGLVKEARGLGSAVKNSQ